MHVLVSPARVLATVTAVSAALVVAPAPGLADDATHLWLDRDHRAAAARSGASPSDAYGNHGVDYAPNVVVWPIARSDGCR